MMHTVVRVTDQPPTIIYVGQDEAGHWLVQERDRRLEGRFISREAAWHFARAERHGFPGAELAEATHTIRPSFDMSSFPSLDRAA